MQIGEVAAKAGVNAQTIRFYERRGLLKKPARTRSGYRVYPPSAVGVVRFIKKTQEAGYTLAEIKQLLALHNKKGGNAAEVRTLAEAKIESINRRIESLEKMRGRLQKILAGCQCGGETQPDCPALEAFDYQAADA